VQVCYQGELPGAPDELLLTGIEVACHPQAGWKAHKNILRDLEVLPVFAK
jgi:hypothetical protein